MMRDRVVSGADERAGGGPSVPARLWWRLRWQATALPARLVRLGVPPARLGWRGVLRETPAERIARLGRPGDYREIHPPALLHNPLPATVADRAQLDPDPGWWGYAMRDVPARRAAPTSLARLADIRVTAYRDGPKRNFTVGMIGADGRALTLPQIEFRLPHGALLERAPRVRLARATWILERVYDNHSHWLTAHLPKLILLRSLGLLDDVVLPAERTAAIDASLAMLGIDPAAHPAYATGTVLEVEDLSLVGTDRFRPELLRAVREAFAPATAPAPRRRVLITREKARGRRLTGEAELWPQLEARGFERVVMEDLSFPEQVALMRETAVLIAPHGAGLTNMIFCPKGADIVEIADPAYPNPNFYALASAMGHRYWLLHARAKGTGHPLQQDLSITPSAVLETVARIDEGRGR